MQVTIKIKDLSKERAEKLLKKSILSAKICDFFEWHEDKP